MDAISEIIKTMNNTSSSVNPTEIYNEGWMTRMLMYYSVKEKLKFKGIDFTNKRWTSEALISSPFVSAKSKREGYTHPDIAIGDFKIDYSVSGKLEMANAHEFGIIEAKMKSQLSKETKNAKGFNQASRNVACIAHNTPKECKTFFFVVLPKSNRDRKKRDGTTIKDLVSKDTIERQITQRVKSHNDANQDQQIDDNLIERVKQCKLEVITYEDWIKAFNNIKIKEELNEFYDACRFHNKVKPLPTV
ncbi:hypothetical protein J1N09_14800 [Aureitalea sp. L0-47]|uniref:hypothetical protein n=1 Tax=Aureitalea sp. L0-47 TaxID=2816962 RepID=UPI002238FE0B|nr:hypothetical protein [Aureitalea sp. L0-47]MCW5521115.1 hypothetical protein [Aureitalea sp. L0-47]